NFPNLLDEDGNNTGVAFNISFAATNPGVGDDAIPGQNYPIPQIYLHDFWQQGSTATSMIWWLSGLDSNSKYDLRCVPYIDSAASARLSIDGGTTWTSMPSSHPTTVDFDDPNYISINDISPNSSGEILINLMSGNAGLWLDTLALRLRKQSSEPTPPVSTFRAVTKDATENTSPYGYYEFLPENYDNQTELPLLIFLH